MATHHDAGWMRRRRKVPDVIRRGLRLSFGLAICNSLGFLLANSVEDLGPPKLANNIVQGAKWASITCIVVSAPVTGRVAQVSFERTLGTVTGGFLGFLAYVVGHDISPIQDEVFLVIAASVVGFVSVLVGRALNLDYSAKLYVMTFVLVVMAAEHSSEAAIVAATRISGICFGVLCSVVLSVIIFPKSANCEAVDSMAHALLDLSALHALAWTGGRSEALPGRDGSASPVKRKRKKTDAYVHIGTTEEYAGGMSDKDRRELECEKVLMDVYSKLGACEGFLKDAASEVYCTTIRGRWCFLPGIMWLTLGRWRLPKDEMLEVGTAIRKVARVLWSMHTLFQEGFDEPEMQALLQQYPPDLMVQLRQTSYRAIQDILAAFPDASSVDSEQLHRFVQGYQVLIKTADWHRRRVVRYVRAGMSRTPPPSHRPSNSGDTSGATSQAVPWGTPESGDLDTAEDEDAPSLAAAIDRSYQALHGLSPPLLGNGGSGARLPSHGSWASQLQERSTAAAAATPELMFPETTAGHIAEVRWYTFQFILAQLTDELSDMHNAMARLLVKFPHTLLPPRSATPTPGSSRHGGAAYAPLLTDEMNGGIHHQASV